MPYEKELIQHLSKEIEIHVNAITAFRTKIGFTVFLGPYVLLASFMVGTRQAPQIGELSFRTIAALVFLCLCYLALAIMAGLVERKMWIQCNRWRTQIGSLIEHENVDPTSNNIRFSEKSLVKIYLVAFFLFFVSFLVMVYVITSIVGPGNLPPIIVPPPELGF